MKDGDDWKRKRRKDSHSPDFVLYFIRYSSVIKISEWLTVRSRHKSCLKSKTNEKKTTKISRIEWMCVPIFGGIVFIILYVPDWKSKRNIQKCPCEMSMSTPPFRWLCQPFFSDWDSFQFGNRTHYVCTACTLNIIKIILLHHHFRMNVCNCCGLVRSMRLKHFKPLKVIYSVRFCMLYLNLDIELTEIILSKWFHRGIKRKQEEEDEERKTTKKQFTAQWVLGTRTEGISMYGLIFFRSLFSIFNERN